MKISRFTDSQIMTILKQNEAGASVPDLCREHGRIPQGSNCLSKDLKCKLCIHL